MLSSVFGKITVRLTVFNLKTSTDVNIPEQCLYLVWLIMKSFCYILSELLVEKAWKAQTQWKDEKHTRDYLQACNRKGERSNGQLSDLIPTRNGVRQECPSSPLLSLFISDMHSQTAKLRRVHWSNTWHISNQLPILFAIRL